MKNARYLDFLNASARRMQILGENTFRIRAFSRAARILGGLEDDIDSLLADGTITDLDGIGEGIATELAAYKERRTSENFERLQALLPQNIDDLFKIQGLGPKRIRTLYQELGIGSLPDLKAAIDNGQVAQLPGMGKKTVENIQKELARLDAYQGRTPFADAWPQAQEVLEALREHPDTERAEIAGSLRRGRITVGDLDIVLASTSPDAIMDAFVSLPLAEDIIGQGRTKSTIRLAGGLSCDLRVVSPEVFGATLHHFTGSKDHNILMRKRAKERGLHISEYGVFKDGDDNPKQPIACATEADIYRAVNLPFIAPELREGRDEIRRAENDDLPQLPTLDAIRCDLHMHTTWSDGRASIEEMAIAARERGRSWICITDHSQSLHVAGGLDPERLRAQIAAIDTANDNVDGIRILKGLEVDILQDGSLDMDNETLSKLDWVIGSVHQWTRQSKEEMTARVVRAVQSGFLSALGHPTGRLIGKRAPYDIDLPAVLEACAEQGVAVEINGSPRRLDLDSAIVRNAQRETDLWFVLNTDAHSPSGLDQMAFAVMTARRGALPASRILNTLRWEEWTKTVRKPGARQK